MKKEVVNIVEHRGVLSFESNGKHFPKIPGWFFTPISGMHDSQMTVDISLKRDGEVFDKGSYGYVDRDNQAFTLKKIIPQFFKKHKVEQETSLDLMPIMFINGDQLEFEHNSKFSFTGFSFYD